MDPIKELRLRIEGTDCNLNILSSIQGRSLHLRFLMSDSHEIDFWIDDPASERLADIHTNLSILTKELHDFMMLDRKDE